MASTNVNLNDAAYARLKKLRQPGQSFSDVVLENILTRADTCGEVLDMIERTPPPAVNLDRMDQAIKSRKRRSKR